MPVVIPPPPPYNPNVNSKRMREVHKEIQDMQLKRLRRPRGLMIFAVILLFICFFMMIFISLQHR